MKNLYWSLYARFWDAVWRIWHVKLRKAFDPEGVYLRSGQSRPCWHICCNGDAGGWRTRVCDAIEKRAFRNWA